jgi:hypothetical protein
MTRITPFLAWLWHCVWYDTWPNLLVIVITAIILARDSLPTFPRSSGSL